MFTSFVAKYTFESRGACTLFATVTYSIIFTITVLIAVCFCKKWKKAGRDVFFMNFRIKFDVGLGASFGRTYSTEFYMILSDLLKI